MAKGDMFLRVEGKTSGLVKGEANGKDHIGEIEVREWSWGMQSSSSLGGAGKASRSSLSELRVTKGVDSASTALMSVMRNNEAIKKLVLTARKAGGAAQAYLTLTMERARIVSIDVTTSGLDSYDLLEHLSFVFEKIDVTYHAQDDAGKPRAATTFGTEVTS